MANEKEIVVTQADKGGGIVIMDRSQYIEKMQNLLSVSETYEKKQNGYADKQSKLFNQKARKMMKSERGKQLYHLLEEAPSVPKMRGQPKMHKDGIPMRPITSGIGSDPHNLAERLAQPLTRTLGSISEAHIKTQK